MQRVLVSKLKITVNGTFWKIVKCQYVAQTEGGKLPQKTFGSSMPQIMTNIHFDSIVYLVYNSTWKGPGDKCIFTMVLYTLSV